SLCGPPCAASCPPPLRALRSGRRPRSAAAGGRAGPAGFPLEPTRGDTASNRAEAWPTESRQGEEESGDGRRQPGGAGRPARHAESGHVPLSSATPHGVPVASDWSVVGTAEPWATEWAPACTPLPKAEMTAVVSVFGSTRLISWARGPGRSRENRLPR